MKKFHCFFLSFHRNDSQSSPLCPRFLFFQKSPISSIVIGSQKASSGFCRTPTRMFPSKVCGNWKSDAYLGNFEKCQSRGPKSGLFAWRLDEAAFISKKSPWGWIRFIRQWRAGKGMYILMYLSTYIYLSSDGPVITRNFGFGLRKFHG